MHLNEPRESEFRGGSAFTGGFTVSAVPEIGHAWTAAILLVPAVAGPGAIRGQRILHEGVRR